MTGKAEGDHYAIVCNYAEGTGSVSTGAKAYVSFIYFGGNLPGRLLVSVRSRGGRRITTWENTKRLTNFRVKTVPPEHPMHSIEDLLVTLPTREEVESRLDMLRRLGVAQ